MSIKLFSEAELKQLKQDDLKIDKLSNSEIDNDLTNEQKEVAKKMRQSTRKVFNLDTTKRQKEKNNDKCEIINNLRESLLGMSVAGLEVTNPEREMYFNYNGVKYKIVLSAPRK